MRSNVDDEVARPLAFPHARVAQVRIARPTKRLEEVVKFYRDGLGLPELTRFKDHDGYDGVMLGLPDATYHLELTQETRGGPSPAPSADDLLVLYIPDASELVSLCERLNRQGYRPVAPQNPYWLRHSVTFEDPDGWRVVLSNTHGI
ncbi:MAG TPA: VOC family protein [Steroidobacteraceae bacterium]|nr:VOC family protein [Steroidobacteraceae bacterium]